MNVIQVQTSSGSFYFSPKEIIRCNASNNYTWFYLTDKRKLLVAKTLGKYEITLSANNFIRIHRACIINRLHIAKVGMYGNVWLTDGTRLTISKRRRTAVYETLLRA